MDLKTWALTLLYLGAVFVPPAAPVDRSKFRTCAQSAFCTRARKVQPDQSPYRLDLSTLTPSSTGAEVVLVNSQNDVKFRLEITAIKDGSFRFKIKEAFPLIPR